MTLKAQTVSTDAFIAIALFIIIMIFFFAVSGDRTSEIKVKDLESESSKLASAVSGVRNQTSSFVVGTKIVTERLEELSKLSYSELKNYLGIEADFCIHFEDEFGNVINITGNKTGLGSAFIVIGGVNCG